MKRILSIVLTLALLLTALPLALGVSAAETVWTLVTDVSKLNAGDQVIIVAKDYDYALSTTQNNNNRGQAAITKDTDTTIIINDSVQILTLEAGNVSGTFAFNTGSGYLYAASSSSNYLKTETTLSDNSSWLITIADGVTTITAQGTYSRNLLRYNQSNSLFSCYSSGQKDICLYVGTEGDNSETPTCEHAQTKYEIVDETTHKIVCTAADCGKTVKSESHDFSNGDCVCGQTAPESHYDLTKDYYMTATDSENNVYYFSGITSGGGDIATDASEAMVFNLEFDGINYYIYTMDGQTKSYLVSGDGTQKYSFSSTPCAFAYSSLRDTLYEKTYSRAPAVYVKDGNAVNIRAYAVGTNNNFTNNLVVRFVVVPETTECTHANTTTTNTATYFKDGKVTVYCEDCGTTVSETDASAIKENPVTFTSKLDPATNKLTVTWEYSAALATDIATANACGLKVNYSIGGKNITVVPEEIGDEGGEAIIDGINATRFEETLSFGIVLTVDSYDALTLNADDIVIKNVIDSTSTKAEAYNNLVDAITTATEAVVAGEANGNDYLNAGASKVDIKNATAEIKFNITSEYINTIKAYGSAGRSVTLVVTIGNDVHNVTLEKLMSSLTVKISGLSFEQMYGNISAQLVITYADNAEKNITTDAVTFGFVNNIGNSNNTVAKALVELMK